MARQLPKPPGAVITSGWGPTGPFPDQRAVRWDTPQAGRPGREALADD